jgi:hypothetical protein
MGKLTQYQESGFQFSGMPQISTAPIQEALASNERVDRFLSQVGQTFAEKANVYASEQAVKDAITNPITKEQIDQARQTGGNPIEQFLTGGTTYNDAIKKVMGQQVAGELRLELDQMSSDILEQVRTGQITNQGQALQMLQEPISAHIEFLSGIDPVLAEGYGAQATASARNYLNQADTIIRNQEEEKRLFNAETMKANVERDYENFLLANPNADRKVRNAYKDVIRQMARDMSFSGTRKQEKLAQQLDESLQLIDDGHSVKVLADKYKGKTIDEVLDALPKDKSVEASDYMQSTNKEQFARLLKDELNNVNANIAARDRIAKRQLDVINNSYLAEGQRIPPAMIKEMYDLLEPGSELVDFVDEMVKQSNAIEQLNKSSLPDLIVELEDLMDRKIRLNEDLTIPETQRLKILQPYVKNMSEALAKDPVGLIGKRDGQYKELDLNSPTLANDVLQRKQLIERNAAKYGISDLDKDTMLLSKNEVDAFVSTYLQADGQQRTAMLQVLDKEFGADNSAALTQLVNGGLPTTAELSSYFNNPTLTERFLSFDDEEEQKRLKQVAKEKNTSYNDIRKEIANKFSEFNQVVMRQNEFNTSISTAKMDNIHDAFTYLAITHMQSGMSQSSAIKKAAEEFTDKFQIKDTYYVPTIYNGDEISAEEVITKAERIKDIHLEDFNGVPFGSLLEIADEEERMMEFKTQLVENGRWHNMPDGTGLIFGITMGDGSFAPIVNEQGNNLSFKFDDLTMTVPGTNIDITPPEGETIIERRGRKTRARERLQKTPDELRRLEEKKARGKKVFGLKE